MAIPEMFRSATDSFVYSPFLSAKKNVGSCKHVSEGKASVRGGAGKTLNWSKMLGKKIARRTALSEGEGAIVPMALRIRAGRNIR